MFATVHAQRTPIVGERITGLHLNKTRLDQQRKLRRMFLYVVKKFNSNRDHSKLVKVETSRTVILPPILSVQ